MYTLARARTHSGGKTAWQVASDDIANFDGFFKAIFLFVATPAFVVPFMCLLLLLVYAYLKVQHTEDMVIRDLQFNILKV